MTTETPDPRSSSGYQIIGLEDYLGASRNIGGTTTVTVSGKIPSTGLAYVTIHLDYGLKKTTGWTKDDPGLDGQPPFHASNTTRHRVREWSGDDPQRSGRTRSRRPMGTDPHESHPQEHQRVQEERWCGRTHPQVGTGNAVPGLTVELLNAKKQLVTSGVSDEDGWTMMNYKYTGKAATFYVRVPALGKLQAVTLKANGFALAIFEDSAMTCVSLALTQESGRRRDRTRETPRPVLLHALPGCLSWRRRTSSIGVASAPVPGAGRSVTYAVHSAPMAVNGPALPVRFVAVPHWTPEVDPVRPALLTCCSTCCLTQIHRVVVGDAPGERRNSPRIHSSRRRHGGQTRGRWLLSSLPAALDIAGTARAVPGPDHPDTEHQRDRDRDHQGRLGASPGSRAGSTVRPDSGEVPSVPPSAVPRRPSAGVHPWAWRSATRLTRWRRRRPSPVALRPRLATGLPLSSQLSLNRCWRSAQYADLGGL